MDFARHARTEGETKVRRTRWHPYPPHISAPSYTKYEYRQGTPKSASPQAISTQKRPLTSCPAIRIYAHHVCPCYCDASHAIRTRCCVSLDTGSSLQSTRGAHRARLCLLRAVRQRPASMARYDRQERDKRAKPSYFDRYRAAGYLPNNILMSATCHREGPGALFSWQLSKGDSRAGVAWRHTHAHRGSTGVIPDAVDVSRRTTRAHLLQARCTTTTSAKQLHSERTSYSSFAISGHSLAAGMSVRMRKSARRGPSHSGTPAVGRWRVGRWRKRNPDRKPLKKPRFR